jgi:molybdate transport system regulatory protein
MMQKTGLINVYCSVHCEMSDRSKFKPSFKVWIEFEGKRVMGKGGAAILEQIDKLQSISKTAKKLNMSYRYVWNYLDEVKSIVGEPVVETFKGGKVGGGGARLNELGKYLLNEYNQISCDMARHVSSKRSLGVRVVKISARNHLKGKVIAVKKDGVMALVKIKVIEPAEITALISDESVDDLKIKVGDDVEAIVKATEVMIAK